MKSYLNLVLCVTFVFLGQNIFAKMPCEKELELKKLEMSVIASNILNINTTRTPEGGAYKTQSLVCNGKECEVIKSADFIYVYEPGHPNANENDIVEYPFINKNMEIKKMLAVSENYEQILKNCK